MTDIIERMQSAADFNPGASAVLDEAVDEMSQLRARNAELERKSARSSERLELRNADLDDALKRIAELEQQLERAHIGLVPEGMCLVPHAQLAAAPQPDIAARGWDAQAYASMRDEVEFWKKRAAESDEALERISNDLSPTHMGEPVIPRPDISAEAQPVDECEALSQDPKIEHRHVLAITNAYEQGVGKGHYAAEYGKEVSNPYSPEWGCDIAWQMGCEEGLEQVANGPASSNVSALVEALEAARNGLEWYQNEYPDQINGCDDEAMSQINAALAAAQPAPSQGEDA